MSRNLILLHAALGSKEQFNDFIKVLPKDWNIWTFDFEGHGKNSSEGDFSMQTFVDNTLDFMKKNQIEKSHFFGYSMGGYVALYLAKLHPYKVEGIITLATKFDWTPFTASKEVLKLQADVIEEKVPIFVEILKKRHRDWKAVLRKTAELMTELGKGKGKLKAEEMAMIDQKVLLCLGENDQMISLKESEEAANWLPNSSLKLIKDLSHSFENIDNEQYINICKIIKNQFKELN